MLTIIFCGSILVLFFYLFVDMLIWEHKRDMIRQRLIQEFFENQNRKLVSHFSVSDYLSRIEQEHVKILQEREGKEPYTIILWIGLDGLRMNNDGMFEWITKKKKEKKEDNIAPIQQDFLEQRIQQCFCAQSQPLPLSYQIGSPTYYPCYYPLPQYQCFYPFMYQTQTIENQIREQTQQLDQNIRTLKMQLLQQEMNTQNIKYYSKFP